MVDRTGKRTRNTTTCNTQLSFNHPSFHFHTHPLITHDCCFFYFSLLFAGARRVRHWSTGCSCGTEASVWCVRGGCGRVVTRCSASRSLFCPIHHSLLTAYLFIPTITHPSHSFLTGPKEACKFVLLPQGLVGDEVCRSPYRICGKHTDAHTTNHLPLTSLLSVMV
jgi:hypothetical protein